jgi:hypothetical protein
MKTAMQELIESLENDVKTNTRLRLKIESFKEHLEKEKQQIIYSYTNGSQDMALENKYEPLEYYNQTYNQNK